MKAILFIGDTNSQYVSRDTLLRPWLEYFENKNIEYTISGSFDPSKKDELIDDYDVALGIYIRDDIFTSEFMEKHPNLKYCCTFAHGYGNIDLDYAEKHNITFTNTIYGDHTIAEFTMALLLEVLHHVKDESVYYKNQLEKHCQVTETCSKQMELYGKTVGIIGLGSIGYCFAKMCYGFGCHVLSYSRHRKEGNEYAFIEQVSLDELLERSDILSIHCPLTKETKHMIDAIAMQKMKDGVIVLNTARGDIIDEKALVNALKSGKIYAAGLDVVSGEPLEEKSEIFDCDNAIITSHIAWLAMEARLRTMHVAIENFDHWLNGKPTSVIK